MSNSQSVLDSDQSETWSVPNSVMGETDDDDIGSEDCSQTIAFPPGTNVLYEDVNYHILSDGHFITEVPGLDDESDEDDIFCPVPPKKKSKVRFTFDPIRVRTTSFKKVLTQIRLVGTGWYRIIWVEFFSPKRLVVPYGTMHF